MGYEKDTENVIESQLEERDRYVNTLKSIFNSCNLPIDGTCSQEEFEKHIRDPHMRRLLASLDVDPRDAVALFKMLDTEGNGCTDLEEFICGCVTLRGGAKAVHLERNNL